MEVKQVTALPKELEVTAIEMTEGVLTLTAISTQAHPACPLCGRTSTRVHSRYMRQCLVSTNWGITRLHAQSGNTRR